MAAVPAALYYASILMMIEAESRRLGTKTVEVARGTLVPLTLRYGYHFISIFVLAYNTAQRFNSANASSSGQSASTLLSR